jgi:hypothetical protein
MILSAFILMFSVVFLRAFSPAAGADLAEWNCAARTGSRIWL